MPSYKRKYNGSRGGYRRTRRRKRINYRPLAIKCAKTIAEKKASVATPITELSTTKNNPQLLLFKAQRDDGSNWDYTMGMWGMINGSVASRPANFADFHAMDMMKFPQQQAFTDPEYSKRVGRQIFYRKSYRRMTIQMNVKNDVSLASESANADPLLNTRFDGLPTHFRVFHFRFRDLKDTTQDFDWKKDFFKTMGTHTEWGPDTSISNAIFSTPTNVHLGFVNATKYEVLKEYRFVLDNPLIGKTGVTNVENIANQPYYGAQLNANSAYYHRGAYPDRKTISLTDIWNTQGTFKDKADEEPSNFNFSVYTLVLAYKLQGGAPNWTDGEIYLEPNNDQQNKFQVGPSPQGIPVRNPPLCNNFKIFVDGQTTAFDM